ncbi:MAG: hypothetical protein JSU09_16405 [Bacteroidetes bacterium]|nr:hypothetical protein [Bacteroidota bacterium]
MKTKIATVCISLFATLCSLAQSKKENVNIINYFASNNQIIGTPMVDQNNEFRFYPDLSFQDAITGIEVYYFVLNDVHKHHLTKREDGRYWSCIMRDFSLGEAIQRVEVIVDCSVENLNKTLGRYGLKPISIKDFNPYLLLRRGEDRTLYNISLYENIKQEGIDEKAKLTNSLNNLNSTIKEFQNRTERLNSRINEIRATQQNLSNAYNNINSNYRLINQAFATLETKYKTSKELPTGELNELKKRADSTIRGYDNYITLIKTNAPDNAINEFTTEVSRAKSDFTVQFEIFKSDINKSVASSFDSTYKAIQEKIRPLTLSGIPTNYEREKEAIRQIGSNSENRLYSAYVENRAASMLDMRYKKSDTTIIQFNYRNDKQSLQYLQAGDPQEKLGIFRARLVPFPFYNQSTTGVSTTDDNFKWQRGKVIYEIGINFGYAIVKDDHFIPRFFDINRLGLGIGISADTFSDKPTFLSVSLTYDMNTYTSLSFGANLIDKPGFYMGVGINARAFKDLVKNSGALFK